jgi:uncharacterized protein YegL
VDEASEAFTVFPVFVLADTSLSMSGPAITALNDFLPDLQKEMRSNPIVGEIARIGLVTFDDDAQIVLPLCDLAFASLPKLDAGGQTNFAEAFRRVRIAIVDGMAALPAGTPVYRPVIFFLTDGQHVADEDWHSALDALRDRSWKYAPEIVAFGFGDADSATLRTIATRFSFLARESDPAVQVREITRALIGSIRTTSTSFRDPNQQDGLHLQAPAEYFTPLAPIV